MRNTNAGPIAILDPFLNGFARYIVGFTDGLVVCSVSNFAPLYCQYVEDSVGDVASFAQSVRPSAFARISYQRGDNSIR